jgi:hypothetical protein
MTSTHHNQKISDLSYERRLDNREMWRTINAALDPNISMLVACCAVTCVEVTGVRLPKNAHW